MSCSASTSCRCRSRSSRCSAPTAHWQAALDWAWPEHKLFGEFDGEVKYLRYRRPGETVTQAVLREKRREDELRELTDFGFIRFIWVDLFRGEQTAGRVRAKLRRPAA